jgi:hypothetical protein
LKYVSQEVMDTYEQLYMDLYRDAGIPLLNSREAGSKGKLSEETKKRVSDSLKGNVPWNKGLKGVVKMSEETRAKMRESAKNVCQKWKIGSKMPETTREALRKANTGSKRTEEQRKRLSDAMKGKPYHGKNNGKVRTKECRELHRQIQIARTDNKGESHHLSKFTNEQILEIRAKYIPRVYTTYMLAKEYGMSKTNIKDIINRKIWRHI